MDDLTELLALAETDSPAPEDLTERLWPAIRDTYRTAADFANTETGVVDQPVPAEIQPIAPLPMRPGRHRSRRPLAAVAAIVLALAVAGALLVRAAGDTATRPVNDDIELPAAPSIEELCLAVADGTSAAVERGDVSDLDALIASLRELADRAETTSIPGTDATTSSSLRRAANTFEQAQRTYLAGDLAVAIQAAAEARWTPPASGPLSACAS